MVLLKSCDDDVSKTDAISSVPSLCVLNLFPKGKKVTFLTQITRLASTYLEMTCLHPFEMKQLFILSDRKRNHL